MWVVWMLAIVFSVSSSVYITSKPQISIIRPIANNNGSAGQTTAQAAIVAEHPVQVVTPLVNATPGKLSDGVPILMYHSISETEVDNKLCVSPTDLEQQLDYLVREGYHTLTVKDLLAAANGKAMLPPKPLILTFDDGYRNNYTVAYPLLKARGMVATIFVITEKIGTPNGISPSELREMVNNGMEIGSHTRHHFDLRTLEPVELADEIAGSRRILADVLRSPVETFCYPSGKYSPSALEQVKTSGYLGAVTTEPGVMSDQDKRWLMPRIRVSGGESLEQYIASLPRSI